MSEVLLLPMVKPIYLLTSEAEAPRDGGQKTSRSPVTGKQVKTGSQRPRLWEKMSARIEASYYESPLND